jgi:4'-phosphopantetheinyl transferase EntD
VLGDLLPGGLGWAERFDDVEPGDLFGEEATVIAGAVPSRQREFATGRWCARQALARLGHPPVPIPRGDRGAPGWPPGVVGAITHCAGYRAAVAADSDVVLTVGVDAEPDAPLPAGVLDAISLPAERTHLAALAADDPAVCWDRLLFSAKESVYKAWFPLAKRWLDFDQARIDIQPAGDHSGTFAARLLIDGPVVAGHGQLSGFTGRWLARRGLVVTAIVLMRDPQRA